MRRCGVQLVNFRAWSFKTVRRRNFLLFALIGGFSAFRSEAQNAWPAHVSRFIVPFAPAGALDTPARMIAQRLGSDLGATFIVENRAGAGGAVGAQAVVEAAPDGSTFLFTSSSVAIWALRSRNLAAQLRPGPARPLSDLCGAGQERRGSLCDQPSERRPDTAAQVFCRVESELGRDPRPSADVLTQ